MAGLEFCGEALWQLLSENGISCPDNVRDILKNTNYDNLCLLASFKPTDLESITTFYKETLHLLIDETDREKYYGLYKNRPELFALQGGTSKAILCIADECKKIMRKRQAPQTQDCPVTKVRRTSQVRDSSPVKPTEAVLKQKEALEGNINKYCLTTVPEICPDHHYCANATVVALDKGMFTAKVGCLSPSCDFIGTVSMNQAKNWNTSNFYKHLRSHIKDPPPATQKISNFLKINPAPLVNYGSDEEEEDNPRVITDLTTSDNDDDLGNITDSNDEGEGFQKEGGSKSAVTSFLLEARMKQRSLIYFSRSERNKRELEAISWDRQPKITLFFPVLNEVECLRREIEDLKKQVISAMNMNLNLKHTGNEDRCFGGLLQDLVECAIQNQDKKPKGRRYTIESLRKLCVLFYLLGGPMLYELFAANLIIPSLSLTKTILLSSNVMKEGEFRFESLKIYLTSRGAPLEVYLSEDATRITGRVLYHPSTNQIVGFVPSLNSEGVPVVGSYPATSAEIMARYFKESETSNNAYVIMAQPISTDPPFCLAIFGTNNKFKSVDVVKRWSWMVSEAETHGIKVAGFASDGDPKLLSAMRFKTFVPSPASPWKWFHANLISAQVFYQDYVHLLVKLKTRLLKPSIILPMGPKFLASKGHLFELIDTVKKDVHELAKSYLDNKDKMNFRSADKICSVKVVTAMDKNIPRSDGTIIYLNMMRETFLACSDPGLSPLQRIDTMWEWVIFLRIWGNWIDQHDGYSLSHNFITANAYYCIELNAHALIQSIVCCRNSEQPCLFKPWCCSSQPCESCFRKARSLTSTFMTQINFSILELLYRMRRIDYLSEAYVTLRDKYNFPREQRAFEAVKNAEFVCVSLPEDIDIDFTVQAAFKRANATAMRLKLITKPLNQIPPPVFTLSTSNLNFSEETTNDDEDDVEIDSCFVETEEFPSDPDPDRDCDDVHLDVEEDMCVSQLDKSGLRSFNNVEVTPTSPLVKVPTISGGYSIIKKSSYCWFLSTGHTKLSNDRLQRVKTADVQHKRSTSGQTPTAVEENDEISIGQWCAFVSEQKKVVFGRIMAFSFLGESSWKKQEFSGNHAVVNHQGERDIGCLCSWFSYKSDGRRLVLQDISMDLQGYYDIRNYICTVPRPLIGEDGKLTLTCLLKDIRALAANRLSK